MNRVLQLLMAATLMTGFAACSSDDDMTNNFPEDGVVRFNVGVNNPQTRASHTDGSKVTEFGICITNNANSNYTYNNVKVTGSNTTAWNQPHRCYGKTPLRLLTLWLILLMWQENTTHPPRLSLSRLKKHKSKTATQATSLSARCRALSRVQD